MSHKGFASVLHPRVLQARVPRPKISHLLRPADLRLVIACWCFKSLHVYAPSSVIISRRTHLRHCATAPCHWFATLRHSILRRTQLLIRVRYYIYTHHGLLLLRRLRRRPN